LLGELESAPPMLIARQRCLGDATFGRRCRRAKRVGRVVQIGTGFEDLVLARCSVFFSLLGVSACRLLFRAHVVVVEAFA